jgi:cytochrome c oxidase cbb3-type subunit III
MLLSRKFSLSLGLVLLCAGALHVSRSLAQQDDHSEDDFKAASLPGQHTFNSTCAGCHGLDGRGSDKAANIAGSVKVRHLSDAQISSIISDGVPGTGMPAFHNLKDQQIRAVVGYLRILQGKLEARALPGDATRGKGIFFRKGECSTCHTISGEGGFLGPDLSAYGSTMSAKAVRDEIVKQSRTEPIGYQPAVLTTHDGDRLEGVVRNEDNFSVQLQTRDGSFHFFQKSDLQGVEPLGHSLMPTDYGQRLSPDELNDLVSYLMSAGPTPDKPRSPHKTEDPTK